MIKHIFAIAAGKGGVGKSTVAVNLALALQKKGARVGLIDADLYGPSVRHMLPEERLPEQSLDDSAKILPAYAKGLSFISMSFFRRADEASIVRAPIANSTIIQFIQSVIWGDLDYLIIDFPPGTGDIQLTLAQQANLSGAFLVTLPQALASIDVLKAAQLFEQTKVPILGIIENMHDLFPGDAGDFLSNEIGVPLLSRLPFDTAVCKCADRGLDLFKEAEGSNVAKAFMDLAIAVETQLISYKDQDDAGLELQFALKDPRTLRLEWNDGLVREIPLCELQEQCPCIRCKENRMKIDPQVEADEVYRMGRYALSIRYRSGCARGIYPFTMLHLWRTRSCAC